MQTIRRESTSTKRTTRTHGQRKVPAVSWRACSVREEGGHTWARASDDLQLKGVVALRRGPLGTFRQVLEALKAVGIVKMKIFLKGTRMFM